MKNSGNFRHEIVSRRLLLLVDHTERFDPSGLSKKATGGSDVEIGIPRTKSVIFGVLILHFGALFVRLSQWHKIGILGHWAR